ncbi:hypothetical protein AA0472_2252 [Acetobacter estunensis NRIC 0472]|uniref:Uncharacterized protein n=1 Tax=Acetobacter estunensis TaxID=104097 RepID=A0A967BCM2_9PROT|nr:hypothetical protein [Acetobacter estunensis]NHO53927.1 hypothetical protein [Acetobacter estunensis]GBQ26874.1 hypothetical protein AA0472_2252 [Acetobacter estunensis NRIC 0472]
MEMFAGNSFLSHAPTELPLSPGLLLFLPSTSPVTGGLLLRSHRRRESELLLPNPFGAGLFVTPADSLEDLGFVPTAFDRVLLRQLGAVEAPGFLEMSALTLSTAVAGFAGREAQVLARKARAVQAERQSRMLAYVQTLFGPWEARPDVPERLAAILVQMGFCPSEDARRLHSAVPTMELLRRELGSVEDRLAWTGGGVIFERLVRVSRQVLAHYEAVYADMRALLHDRARMTRLTATNLPYAEELALLPGWIRFCHLLGDTVHAHTAFHFLSDMAALAIMLMHRQTAAAEGRSWASRWQTAAIDRPVSVDMSLHLVERNERLLRMACLHVLEEI